MLDLGLLDIIGKKHVYDNAPRTQKRSKNSPIDCISCALGGFLSFGKLDGDRGLWVDIPKRLLFGCKIPPHTNPGARRLKLKDPRVVGKYLSFFHDDIVRMNEQPSLSDE